MSKLYLKISIILVLTFESYCVNVPKPIEQNKIADILLKSSTLIAGSPQRSLECFQIYIPKLNQLTETYEVEYETCLKRTSEAREIIDLEVQQDRSDLEESAESICNKFKSCSHDHKSAYDFFECFNEAAAESTKAAYNIQNVSSDKLQYIKLKYETIEYDQNRCTDKCSRVYVEETTKTYEELDKCLAGVGVDEPTQIPNVKNI